MDLESIMLSEISQTEKNKYYMFTYVWNLKTKQTNKYNRTETDSQIQRTNLQLPEAREWGEKQNW